MNNKYVINKNFVSVFFLVALVVLTPFLKSCSQSSALHDRSNAIKTQKEMAQYRLELREQKTRFNRFLAQAKSSLSGHDADVYQKGDILVIRLKGLSFPSAVSEINQRDYSLLSKVKSIIENSGRHNVIIEGYADSSEGNPSNAMLSRSSALAVRNFLSEHSGENSLNIKTAGLDYQKPIATNTTSNGRAQNRRVEIFIFSGDENSRQHDINIKRESWPLL